MGQDSGGKQDMENGFPVIDISYVKLPEKLTYRIDAGCVLSTVAFLDLFVFIPGTVEDNPVLTVAFIFLLAVCVRLAAREESKRK